MWGFSGARSIKKWPRGSYQRSPHHKGTREPGGETACDIVPNIAAEVTVPMQQTLQRVALLPASPRTMAARLDFVRGRRARRPILSVGNTRSARNSNLRQPLGLAVASASFPGLAVISAAGNVERATVPALRNVLRTALQAGRHIVLDLGRVTFFDEAGFRECVASRRLCQRNQHTLALVNPSPVVRQMVQILDVNRVLTPFASARDASKALMRGARLGRMSVPTRSRSYGA